MKFLASILLAPLPSIIWLSFYLRKDKHPEPNKLIIKIFLLGVLVVPLAGILEQLFFLGTEKFSFLDKVILIVIVFAFIEELLKYLVVKFGILKNPEFDEPIDAMIYMIIAGLGFAAAENIYLLSQIYPQGKYFLETLEFLTTRFLGATLLHALACGITGYFFAASLLMKSKMRKIFTMGGILAATILHSIFNYIIILNSQGEIDSMERNLYLIIILVSAAVIVSLMFKKANKYRSICKI
ncbi:MAG: PrsW family intramembrane metalloprotease [bacterium]|nr:PrsW family intramembrane metalloprotease [bacterium]